MLGSTVHVKESLNSFVSSGCFRKAHHWFRLMFISLFHFCIAPATLTVFSQLIDAENSASGKLIF
jgi:hypothetical protein